MNQKQNFWILGSGVLYAAFFQLLSILPTPFLLIAFFLPIFFYAAAFLGGLRSVCLAIGPSLAILVLTQNPLSQIIFTCLFSFLTALLVGYVLDKRKKEFLKEGKYTQWTAHHALIFISSVQIFMLFLGFMIPNFSEFLLENFSKVQNVFEGKLPVNPNQVWPQIIFSITCSYNLLNVFYITVAKKIVEKFTKKYSFHESDKCVDLRADLPFLFFLTIFLALELASADVFYRAMALCFSCIAVLPVIFVGVQSFKKIGLMLGFKRQMVNFILYLLFFLVQGAVIIVLLGLMECCNISRYLRQKKD
jgi:hypothetical protein